MAFHGEWTMPAPARTTSRPFRFSLQHRTISPETRHALCEGEGSFQSTSASPELEIGGLTCADGLTGAADGVTRGMKVLKLGPGSQGGQRWSERFPVVRKEEV
ncbi:hypothetical protein P7K49_000111 [Saguinus oedipus]|uniref:Uncharacterized protein n=1 Tax=Saguinus oedipus TaxID=9490 RepID=A0ABQ9WB97_SAGOE|nr:hypothetical protein P7K49_000111 [Saguinus oedipus]